MLLNCDCIRSNHSVFTICIDYMYIVYNYMSHYINVEYGILISWKVYTQGTMIHNIIPLGPR